MLREQKGRCLEIKGGAIARERLRARARETLNYSKRERERSKEN
jgi:hypothetical protein